MEKITYRELVAKMEQYNRENNITSKGDDYIKGVIVFTEDSYTKPYSLEERSYIVTSSNKAWIDGQGGYSIYGNSMDGSDMYVRLERYMAEEHGGKDGWQVDYCYMLD